MGNILNMCTGPRNPCKPDNKNHKNDKYKITINE